MKKCSIAFIFILYLFDVAYSQRLDSLLTKGHFLGLSTGYGYFRIRDITESPLIYGSSYVPFQLFYGFKNDKSIHEISVFYFKNILKSSITKGLFLSTTNLCTGLDYTLLKKTNIRLINKSSLHIGGAFINYFSIREHNYIEYLGVNADVFSQLSIKSRIRFETKPASSFTWDCSIPFLAFVMIRRYNYGEITDDKIINTGDFLTINRFIDFQSKIQYEKQLGNRWFLNFTYLFRYYQYYRYQKYFPIKAGMNSFELGLKFKL